MDCWEPSIIFSPFLRGFSLLKLFQPWDNLQPIQGSPLLLNKMVCSACVPKVHYFVLTVSQQASPTLYRNRSCSFPVKNKTTTTNLFLWVRSTVKCLIHLARLPIFKIVFNRKWLISAIYSCFLFVLWFISSSLLFPLPPSPISHSLSLSLFFLIPPPLPTTSPLPIYVAPPDLQLKYTGLKFTANCLILLPAAGKV